MKKRTLLTLVLSLAMVLTSISSVFAAPPEKTKEAIAPDIQSMTSLKDEVSAEAFAKALVDQVGVGKYKLMDTATLKTKLDKGEKMVIVDTMPESWWAQRHIPTAINQVVGGNGTTNAPKYEISKDEGTALLKKVNAAVPKKTVTKWYNKKTKKWQTKSLQRSTVASPKKLKFLTRLLQLWYTADSLSASARTRLLCTSKSRALQMYIVMLAESLLG